MQAIGDFIMKFLDPAGVVIGLVVAIPILWTWWEVTLGKRRKYNKWLKEIRLGKSADAVLIVDLLAKDNIIAKVLKYLKNNNIDLPEEKVFKLSFEGNTTPNELPDRINQLRNKLAEISRSAPGNLHLFYGGPAAFAMLMGAEMANKGNVIIYQHTNGEYVNWGPIRHAYF